MDLQIDYIEYSPITRSLDIFTIGCNGNCKNCCNPEIKDFNLKGLSIPETVFKVRDLNNQFDKLIDRIFLVGGDPVDGEKATYGGTRSLICYIKYFIDKPIYLFTRHKLEDVPQSLKECVDFIKTGAYIPELTVDNNIQYGIKLATSNQHIYKKVDNIWI